MNSVDLSEVLLDEMVILDREPFKDKDDMFNVITRNRILQMQGAVHL